VPDERRRRVARPGERPAAVAIGVEQHGPTAPDVADVGERAG
jgi:hypothetical protein